MPQGENYSAAQKIISGAMQVKNYHQNNEKICIISIIETSEREGLINQQFKFPDFKRFRKILENL